MSSAPLLTSKDRGSWTLAPAVYASAAPRRLRLSGLAAASGVRTDGRLDAQKLRRFAHTVRTTDAAMAMA